MYAYTVPRWRIIPQSSNPVGAMAAQLPHSLTRSPTKAHLVAIQICFPNGRSLPQVQFRGSPPLPQLTRVTYQHT